MTEKKAADPDHIVMVFNEKMKALASFHSNMSVAWYTASGVALPTGLLGAALSPDLTGWKATLFIGAFLTLTAIAIYAARINFKSSMKCLEDLR